MFQHHAAAVSDIITSLKTFTDSQGPIQSLVNPTVRLDQQPSDWSLEPGETREVIFLLHVLNTTTDGERRTDVELPRRDAPLPPICLFHPLPRVLATSGEPSAGIGVDQLGGWEGVRPPLCARAARPT